MFRNTMCSSAIVTILSVTGAMADVTPEEVWENWQAMSTSAGQELTVGGSARTGDTLEVSDITITHKDPMGGSASVILDTLSFKDNGDGTVTVVMPDSFPISMAFPPEVGGSNPGSLKLTVTQPGMVIVAGGSAAETSYEFTAPVSAIILDEATDASGAVLDTRAELVLAEVSGRYVVKREGEITSIDTTFDALAMTLNVEGADAGGVNSGKVTLSLADVDLGMRGMILGPDAMANLAVALHNGFTMDMSFGFEGMSLEIDALDPRGQAKIAFGSTGGRIDLALDKERMNYGIALASSSLVASGPDIPFPQVEVGLGEFAFNVLVPVSKSDTPQDFAYLTRFVDLTTSEDVWGLFDPSGTLARDPVTFVVDVKGTGFWNQDILEPDFDFDALEAASELPGELHTLELAEIRAKAAGADVSATGGLTFDNADLVTFGGAPKPAGTITVNIKGVQALIDNLISMGLLPEDEAMGFRMALAMFARPGAGADELISELEFRDGGLFANGQQIW